MMGDYSSSVFAGNLRACYDKPVAPGNYTIQVVFGDTQIHCHYFDGTKDQAVLDCKLESYNRDVFHSVTRDEKHTYIKLVNADAFAKKVQINLDQISASSKADVITLTGDAKWVHTPNVNTKEVERIKPAYSTIPVSADDHKHSGPARKYIYDLLFYFRSQGESLSSNSFAISFLLIM